MKRIILGEDMVISLDEKSKKKAYELFENGFIDHIEVGTVKGLQEIHSYILVNYMISQVK